MVQILQDHRCRNVIGIGLKEGYEGEREGMQMAENTAMECKWELLKQNGGRASFELFLGVG